MNIEKFVVDLMKEAHEHDFGDIDGGDFYWFALKHELIVEREATQNDVDEWGREWDVEIGDPITAFSDEFKQLRKRVEAYDETKNELEQSNS